MRVKNIIPKLEENKGKTYDFMNHSLLLLNRQKGSADRSRVILIEKCDKKIALQITNRSNFPDKINCEISGLIEMSIGEARYRTFCKIKIEKKKYFIMSFSRIIL